jgi:predicted N-acyltransferase
VSLELRIASSISEISAVRWDALAHHEPDVATPFVRHAFLAALEESGCARDRTGWRPRHLTAWRGNRLVAAAPAYLRDRSDGDFGRDWEWAAAAERARIGYYPKLVLAVPFTPATGRRFLVADGEDRRAAIRFLAAAARALAQEEGAHSLHVLFPTPDEATLLEEDCGFFHRIDFQYHWLNAGYATWEQFLSRFPSKRRTAIRRERGAPTRQGIALRTVRGAELQAGADAWAKRMLELHRTTVDRMAWGMRWVNRGFYRHVLEALPDAVEIVEARRAGEVVAAAFNVASRTRLYGRYWGCNEDHPFLHFNVCLYHSIEDCIARGLRAFEGGAGGEHKLSRGFEPAFTSSAHLFLDARLDAPLRRYVATEAHERRAALVRWRATSPVLRPAAGDVRPPSGA